MKHLERLSLLFLLLAVFLLTFTLVIFQDELKVEPMTRRDLVEFRRDVRADVFTMLQIDKINKGENYATSERWIQNKRR